MLSYTDLIKGVLFVRNGDPYEVLESSFSRMQQRKAVVSAKIKNLSTEKIFDVTFQPSDQFEEAEIEKQTLVLLYHHRGEYVFADHLHRENRFPLKEEMIGENKKWLTPNTEVTALFYKGSLLNFRLPIKMDFKVVDAPPGVAGNRAQAGTKAATLETGTIIQVPLFINTGDTVRVNTESGEYVERTEKA